jgi:hypothetical protein
MEEELSPQQSLELITKIIAQAKQKVNEDGVLYMFWGLLISLVSLLQFILLHSENYKAINFIPYYFLPLGTLFSWFYYRRKLKSQISDNNVVQIIKKIWIVASANMFLLGFMFPMVLQNHLVPILLLLMGSSGLLTGWIVQERIMQVAGIVMNISGIAAFMVDWSWQPLQMSITNFVCVFLTGLYLWYQKKVNHVI